MPVFEHDGTTVEYELHGDSAGLPLLVHHGLLGSAEPLPGWAGVAPVTLITVARPGYGRSAPVPMRAIADWADVVTPLLDHLGVGRFGVVGVSAGAPYGYALADRLPHRVTRVATLSGLGTVNEAGTRAHYPAESQRAFASFAAGTEDEIRRFWQERMTESLTTIPDGHPWHRLLTDSLAHDAAGPGREACLQQRDWGFALEKLTTPVALWHSRRDDDVPFATAEVVAARIPGATLHEQPEPGHVPSESTVRAALEYLCR